MGIHIYRCEHPTRTRKMCPYHHHLCYGEKQEFYDTMRIFFDCGTMVDYGYGYYQPPKLYKEIKIFADETGFTAWVPRANWAIIARMVPLKLAIRLAKARLNKNGKLVLPAAEGK